MGMIFGKDNDKSNGVNKGSADAELKQRQYVCIHVYAKAEREPHSDEVLHDEFVYSFRWMCHIDLSLAVFKIGLRDGFESNE